MGREANDARGEGVEKCSFKRQYNISLESATRHFSTSTFLDHLQQTASAFKGKEEDKGTD